MKILDSKPAKDYNMEKTRALDVVRTEFKLNRAEVEGVLLGGMEVKSNLVLKNCNKYSTNANQILSPPESKLILENSMNEENIYSKYLLENQDGGQSHKETLMVNSESIKVD